MLSTLTGDVTAQEGFGIVIPVAAVDPEGHALSVWADNLPPGAVYDPTIGAIVWMPGYESAGIYENVTVYASDGLQIVSRSFRLVVLPGNSAPTSGAHRQLHAERRRVHEHAARRAQTSKARRCASTAPIYRSQRHWIRTRASSSGRPGYSHAGVYDVVFGVTDGSARSERTVRFTVNNANGAPVFDPMGTWDIVEGQPLEIQLFAFDPDNPMFIPRSRGLDGVLRELEGTAPSITYTFGDDLPAGAVFDSETQTLRWLPNQMQAGNYSITVTATDDGNGRAPDFASITIPIIVRNANRSPVIPVIDNRTVARGGDPLIIDVQRHRSGWQSADLPGFGHAALRDVCSGAEWPAPVHLRARRRSSRPVHHHAERHGYWRWRRRECRDHGHAHFPGARDHAE